MRPFTPKYTIEDMQELAALRGGRCLSKEYWDIHSKLTWRCENGHNWEATPYSVKKGSWCPGCTKANRQQLSLEEMQEIAQSRGGKCLSAKYKNSYTKLKWQCSEGHVWETKPMDVKQGKWCRICSYESVKLKIEDMQQIALGRGGRCLSEKYVDNKTKLKWQCKEGHVWEAIPNSVKQGRWCSKCRCESRKLTIGEMQQIALGRGGKCLSEKYVDNKTGLKWQCKEGHVWQAAPAFVKQGSWCPRCAGLMKLTIGEMQQIALGRDGKCLSEKYVNGRTRLKWQCKDKHVWETIPESVKQGNWCPACSKASRQQLRLEEMQEIALGRGGKCLSEKYVNGRTGLKWQCSEGHLWEANPEYVKQGSWCPDCSEAYKKQLSLELMQEIAKSKGGKCLSDKYVYAITKLKWQCRKKHVWEAIPNNVRQGRWCPVCAQEANILLLKNYREANKK